MAVIGMDKGFMKSMSGVIESTCLKELSLNISTKINGDYASEILLYVPYTDGTIKPFITYEIVNKDSKTITIKAEKQDDTLQTIINVIPYERVFKTLKNVTEHLLTN